MTTAETLIAREACTLKTGLLGKRGQLALYGDRLVFSTSGDSAGKALPLERIDSLELRGRGRKILVVGFEGGQTPFKLDGAPARFQDLCALLVQLHPTPPWLDPRFGKADADAVHSFLAPHGERLEQGERLLLWEWALAWSGDDRVHCGWIALTSRRILFLPSSSGERRAMPRVYHTKLIERIENDESGTGQLWFVADGRYQRFDAYGGSEFTREFWTYCDAPLHSSKDSQVRRGESLERLSGPAPMTRLMRTTASDLVFDELFYEPKADRLQTNIRFTELGDLAKDEVCIVEVVKRAGLFRFEAIITRAEPLEDGPFRPSHALLELHPTTDIRFVNRRRAYRVEVNLSLPVEITQPQADGGWSRPISTLCRMVDLSNIGCALVGPADIDPKSRFSLSLPIGTEDETLLVRAECVHVRPLPNTQLSRQYGLHLLGLTQPQRDRIQQEVIRQERLMLQRRSAIRR